MPMTSGVLAFTALLGLYFGVLTGVSGWDFTVSEFARYWYYIVPLPVGFGVQVGLFVRLRRLVGRAKQTGAVVAASGTTSTAAMISCCAHYLTALAPILGATGLVAFVAQFQVQLFWVGFLMSAGGVAFIATRLVKASREHAQCAA